MVLLFCLPYPIKFGMSPGRMLLGVLMFVFNEAWGVFLSKKPNQTKSSGLAALRETSERRLRLDGPTILAELAMSWNVLDDWIECKLWHLNLEKDKAKRERKKGSPIYLVDLIQLKWWYNVTTYIVLLQCFLMDCIHT